MKKYKVFPLIAVFSIFMLAIYAITLCWMLADGEKRYVAVVLIFAFPFLFFVYLGWATIIVNEKGLEKRFLGIKIKEILWTDLQDVKILHAPSGQGWIFFSKNPLYSYGLSRCRIKRGVLYIAIRGNMIEEISTFLPPHIIIRNNN